MAKYKNGQFVKVTVLGKYRAVETHNDPYRTCMACDLLEECFRQNKNIFYEGSCRTNIGLFANLKKVK